jgi:eukaryotic-like serine/threonine-protein kinase
MPLRPGERTSLGRYELLGRLGEGGMGTVYLGRDHSGRPVAIKVIRAEYAYEEEFRGRFRSEVARAQQVPPFSTAEVLDADPDHDPPYLVVEYVDGPSLAAVIKERGPLSGAALHGVAVGIATALTAIHGAGVIHRDLKPGNVLFPLGGVKVIDFGIARAFEATSHHTGTDQMVGTVAYMAPERFDPANGRQVTPAADVFSWGAVVQYAATGRTPFAADSPPATAMRILTQPPDLSGLPDFLHDVVERSLAKEPQDRPTARDLLDVLLAGDTPPPSPTLPPSSSPPPPRRLSAPDRPSPGRVPAQDPLPAPPWVPAPDRVPRSAPMQAARSRTDVLSAGQTSATRASRPLTRTLGGVAVGAAVLVVLLIAGLVGLHNLNRSTDATGTAAEPSPSAAAEGPILRGERRTLIHFAEIDRDLSLDRHWNEVEVSDGKGARSQFVLVPAGRRHLIKSLRSEGHPDDADTCVGVRVTESKPSILVVANCIPTPATEFTLTPTGAQDDQGRPTYHLSNDTYGTVQWSAARKALYVEKSTPTASFSFVDRGTP